MRPKVRKVSQVAALFALILVAGTLFQNCGGYQSGNNPLYDRTEPLTCAGVSCSKPTLEMAALTIGNQPPIRVIKPASGHPSSTCTDDGGSCIDISGYCDAAGFYDNTLYYQWFYNGAPVEAIVSTGYKCDDLGRFRLQARLPTSYVYENVYSIVVTMKVIDGNAVEYDNPVGLHHKEITVEKL